MSDEETINVEEVDAEEAQEEEKEPFFSTEELKVAGEDLIETVKGLVKEAGVRRIVVRREEKTLVEIPLVLGLGGFLLLPAYSALAMVAALVADCTIYVERTEKAPVEEMAEEAEAAEEEAAAAAEEEKPAPKRKRQTKSKS